MRRALVTGGAGFIGSHLVDALLAQNWEVRVLDDLSTGKKENLKHVEGEIDFRLGDIRDLETVRKAAEGTEVVFHLAALGSVPRSVKDPITSNDVNVNGTLNVLVAARDAGTRRVVYSASSSAYGNSPTLPKREDMSALPLSPYAVTKYVGELYLKVFCNLYGLEGVGLRYFNIFGPRQDPTSQYAAVIPKFVTAMMKGERPIIFGDGQTSRDFTYVANAVHANLLAADCRNASGQVVNVACGDRYSLNDLVAKLNELLGTDLAPVYSDERPGDVKHSLASIDAARELLGYEPLVDFVSGLTKTVGWYKERDIA
jgi:nucleoside-diphosphate-sugar epimerase